MTKTRGQSLSFSSDADIRPVLQDILEKGVRELGQYLKWALNRPSLQKGRCTVALDPALPWVKT
ncbi:MAG: hypothetical protein LW720_10740 [Pirellula sp.]|jgi:predicted Zn-dependent protease|nr:hypothetical protein [Pirellula sp.]